MFRSRERVRLRLERLEERLMPTSPAPVYVAMVGAGGFFLVGGFQTAPTVRVEWADPSPNPAHDSAQVIRLDQSPKAAHFSDADGRVLEHTFGRSTPPAAPTANSYAESRKARFLDAIAAWDDG